MHFLAKAKLSIAGSWLDNCAKVLVTDEVTDSQLPYYTETESKYFMLLAACKRTTNIEQGTTDTNAQANLL